MSCASVPCPAAPRGRADADVAAADAAVDGALVVRARAGDPDAARDLVHRHLRAALTVARIVLGDTADAEDACQDAFAAVLARLDRCRPAHNFRPWLLRSVRNRAISLLRRRRIRRTLVLGSAPGETDAPAPSSHDPLRAAERADLRGRLGAALARLSAAERETLLLHHVEGWKHDEIAAHLGVRPGTSRSYLFDARQKLRAALGPELRPGAE